MDWQRARLEQQRADKCRTAHLRRDAVEHDLDDFDPLERLRTSEDLDRFELAASRPPST